MGATTEARKKQKFVFSRQLESSDCGPACLKMVLAYHERNYSLSHLRERCKTNKIGTSLFSILKAAEELGLDAVSARMEPRHLTPEYPLPAVLLWNKRHFVVLVKIRGKDHENRKFLVADPTFGKITLSATEFSRIWTSGNPEGVVAFFEPKEDFPAAVDEIQTEGRRNVQAYLRKLKTLFHTNRKGLILVVTGMLLSSGVSLCFPILTQKLIDTGVHFKSYSFIGIVLGFQCFLFASLLVIDYFKSWLLLQIGSRIELTLVFDFLTKIMRLPLYFFDARAAGDIVQRISDNARIEGFIKGSLLDFVISITTIVALTSIMFHYNATIFLYFLLMTAAGIAWSLYFIRRRELLDYRRFEMNAENVDNIFETVIGMPEIKLNNAEETKKTTWRNIQLQLLDINSSILRVQQYQSIGTTGINQLKNILITFLAAIQVMEGKMSLGEMMALATIVGQLNGPLLQLLAFFQSYQDARISFSRLAEIQFKQEEAAEGEPELDNLDDFMLNFSAIHVSGLQFSYSESEEDLLFNDLSLAIPRGRVTALVGESGSGKTTLMKLLLRFYDPLSGRISLDQVNLRTVGPDKWRNKCGVVMQDGFIFTDTVEKNIALSGENVSQERLQFAAKMACIDSFIETLPLGYQTAIGSKGIGLSAGQKQRLLIARAVYKDPAILFLDEATSFLDTRNERDIQNNLELFFKDRTVFIIAHRLSTVKKADNIIVLDSGKIIEQGSHEALVEARGKYFTLIKNQLDLDQ